MAISFTHVSVQSFKHPENDFTLPLWVGLATVNNIKSTVLVRESTVKP